MTTPLPTAGDTSWYDWATDVDGFMRGNVTVESALTLTGATRNIVEVDSPSDLNLTIPSDLTRTLEVCQVGNGVATLVAPAQTAIRVAPPGLGAKTPGKFGSVWIRPRSISLANPPATDLILRLKGEDVSAANGATVAAWPDSSGLGHPDAAQATAGNRPTATTNAGGTGRKGITFNGSSNFLSLSGSALSLARNKSAMTIFAAMVFPAVTTGVRTIFALSTGTGATSSRVLLGHRESISGLPIAGGRRLDADSLAYTTGVGITTATNAILCGRYLWGSSDIALDQNGAQTGFSGSFQTIGATSDTASLAGTIGSNLAGNGEWLQATILELLVYATGDTDGMLRQYVDSYFQNYYGLTSADYLLKEFIVGGGS